MKIDKIYFCRVPHQAFELMFGLALPQVAKAFDAEYVSVEYKDSYRGFRGVSASNDNTVIFFYIDRYHTKDVFDQVKQRCPNAFFVMIGGDIIYELGEANLFYKGYGVDLHLDPHNEVINELTKRNCLAKKLHLTISREFGQYCKDKSSIHNRDTDFICLARHNTAFRKNFFSQLQRSFSIYTSLPELSTEQLITLYCKSKFTLGTTSPCHEEHKGYIRGLKGFRNWIGPLCGNVIVDDDYPQIIEDFQGIIPTYKYGNIDSLFKLYSELWIDKTLYNIYQEKQLEWIENNYLDDQLIRILGEL